MRDVLRSPERMAALRQALAARGPAQREILDALAQEVAQASGAGVALVSLVLDDAQWFVGAHGLDGWLAEVRGTPVEWSFCADVVRGAAPLEVPDAPKDPRYADNPLVTTGAVGSYHGVPLTTQGGEVLGSLCVLGPPGFSLSGEGMATLRAAAGRAVRLLEAM